MESTTNGTFRVLASPRDPAELLLLDIETQDPTYVTTAGYEGDLGRAVEGLEPGNRITTTLSWTNETPRFADIEVETRTTVAFADDATGIFEVARETWQEAQREGNAMNSRTTRNTDDEANGVVYTFAKQPGQRDLYEEFADGITPLEPLIDRLAASAEPPFAVFVLRPREEPFVPVVLAADRDGQFATTMAETYEGL
ncbi:DUF6663 family protein [Halococcus sp. AFM35]|uniref:DUF6663 family protein n=1 Tax=Halococcus sp. AFM35 TaxID=3421653 RepID=UPI003EBADEFF